MKTYIASNLQVIDSTIIRHWNTYDRDDQGYLTQDGTDRTLCEARATSGEWVLFAETNGDPVVLFEGDGQEFVEIMTDANSDQTRDDVIKEILDAINDCELRDWAAEVFAAE
jgi:hypothetical protein